MLRIKTLGKPLIQHRAFRLSVLDACVLIFIALFGVLHLHYPFYGDQAFYLLGAKEIASGDVLYRDFWDIKQPAIFYFYLLGGKLFGFTELGIRLFELIYLLLFSYFLQRTLSSVVRHPFVASLAPLCTVGMYYCATGPWHMTQLEALVGFPLYGTIWFSYWADQQQKISNQLLGFLGSGICGGIVLLFKVPFLLILMPLWLTAFIYSIRTKYRTLHLTILATAIGILLPWALVLGYFNTFGLVPTLLHTFFVYPRKMLALVGGGDLGRLLMGILRFSFFFLPFIVFALMRVKKLVLEKNENLLNIQLTVWFVMGMGVILIQSTGWWSYYFWLISVPIGILSIQEIHKLSLYFLERFNNSMNKGNGLKRLLIWFLVIFIIPLSATLMKCISGVQGLAMAVRGNSFSAQEKINPNYPIIKDSASFLRDSNSYSGDIFVFGDPLFYYFSGRGQRGVPTGWGMENFLPDQWNQLMKDFQERPPSYVFIDDLYTVVIEERSPQFSNYFYGNFKAFKDSDLGTWYIPKEYPNSGSFLQREPGRMSVQYSVTSKARSGVRAHE